MNKIIYSSRLVYVYAEFCPGDFYWGWWLHACPIRYGLPDRNNKTFSVWLEKYHLDEELFKVLSLDRANGLDNAEVFMKTHPEGIILRFINEREFEIPEQKDVAGFELWKFSKRVRELQMYDWKHDGPRNWMMEYVNEKNAYELLKLDLKEDQ